MDIGFNILLIMIPCWNNTVLSIKWIKTFNWTLSIALLTNMQKNVLKSCYHTLYSTRNENKLSIYSKQKMNLIFTMIYPVVASVCISAMWSFVKQLLHVCNTVLLCTDLFDFLIEKNVVVKWTPGLWWI